MGKRSGSGPYDTTYAPPIIATVNGMRLLIQEPAMVSCTQSNRKQESRFGDTRLVSVESTPVS